MKSLILLCLFAVLLFCLAEGKAMKRVHKECANDDTENDAVEEAVEMDVPSIEEDKRELVPEGDCTYLGGG